MKKSLQFMADLAESKAQRVVRETDEAEAEE